MTSEILSSTNSPKTQKSEHLENETLLSSKNIYIDSTLQPKLAENSSLAEVTLKEECEP